MNKPNFLFCALELKILLKISEVLLLRLPRGTLVRVRYPKYVAGYTGLIYSRERGANRWIVQIQNNSIADSSNPLILSLELLDFEILELPSVDPSSKSTLNNE